MLAELDEQLLDAWADGTVSLDEVRSALRRCTIDGTVVPVLCGSALAGIGIQPLLDAVVDYLPAPSDRIVIARVKSRSDDLTTNRNLSAEDPFAALAFKVSHNEGGRVTWMRLYSGTLRKGTRVLNASTGQRLRPSRLLRLKAGRTEDVDQAHAGDIVAAIGLGDTVTGHTLCAESDPVLFESISFPEPVMAVAIEPRTGRDQDRLSTALSRMADEDPTFVVRTDPNTGQTLIAGMGELHLQVTVDRLADDHGVQVTAGEPEVAYRETIAGPVKALDWKLQKQTGGPGMFARVVIDVEPNGSVEVDRLDFADTSRGGAVPAEFARAVEAGAADALVAGPLGHPVVGLSVTLTDGSVHSNDSSERAFRIAGARLAGFNPASTSDLYLVAEPRSEC